MGYPQRRWLARAAWCLAIGMLLRPAAGAAGLDPAPPDSFTVVVIPDTQAYRTAAGRSARKGDTDLTNQMFANHTRWIADNLQAQHIVFVSHVGDIVDINEEPQWQVARQCMDTLAGKVPYGLVPGNHDMTGAGDTSLFQKYFGAARFQGLSWYGGCFAGNPDQPGESGNNANSYQLFEAAGLKFVIVHLECNAPDDVLAWADGVLHRYADRRALVTTHMDLGPLDKPQNNDEFVTAPKGRMRWHKTHKERGNSPQQMWDKLYRKQANLGFVFSGDQSRTTAMRLEAVADDGHPIHELLSDYESNGPLRLYRFLPAANQVQVLTWNTTRLELTEATRYVPQREQHQFVVPYAMGR